MLDSVFICKYSVGYTLASSSVSGFLSVACDGGSNPYPHLNNKQVNHTTYHYQSIYGVYISFLLPDRHLEFSSTLCQRPCTYTIQKATESSDFSSREYMYIYRSKIGFVKPLLLFWLKYELFKHSVPRSPSDRKPGQNNKTVGSTFCKRYRLFRDMVGRRIKRILHSHHLFLSL